MQPIRMGEVSKEDVHECCREFGREVDKILPRELKLDHTRWNQVWDIWAEKLPALIQEIIRRERQVRDLILTDMQKDSMAYEEGYVAGVEAMRTAILQAMQASLTIWNFKDLEHLVQQLTVPPPGRT